MSIKKRVKFSPGEPAAATKTKAGRRSIVVSCFLALILCVMASNGGSGAGLFNLAYAHTFQGGESADFLTMVQVIKTETSLAGDNAANKDIANDHIEHANQALTNSTLKEIAERNQRLATDIPASIEQLKTTISSGASSDKIKQDIQSISDLLDEAVQVRIEKSQQSNSTVQAVVVANLVNESLEHYGEAIGYEGNMTDMSAMADMSGNSSMTAAMNAGNMNMSGANSNDNSSSTMQGGMNSSNSSGMSTPPATTTTMGNNMTIVSEANYQSSKAFAQRGWETYLQIKPQAIDGQSNAVQTLDKAFPAFISAIESKAPAMDVMSIAHLRIHPNLMTAYDLQVVPEFPVPLLMSLPALAAAILYGRFKRMDKR